MYSQKEKGNQTRRECSECPWTNGTKNNRTMIESIIRWFKNGSRREVTHRCHMISTDLWNETTPQNICIGSLNKQNEENINSATISSIM